MVRETCVREQVPYGVACVGLLDPGVVVVQLLPTSLCTTSLAEFADGKEVTLEPLGSIDQWAVLERIARARSKPPPPRFSLLAYNCETFANDMLYGVRRSPQAENWGAVATGIGVGLLVGASLK